MRLLSLHLTQFRNYASQHVEFDDAPVQLLIGPNGSGKTNVIEAVSVLSTLSSCRGAEDLDMVQWGNTYSRLCADIEQGDGTRHHVEVVTELTPRKRRAFFVDDVRRSATEMLGVLPAVTFLPQDILLFSGPPAARRGLLDSLLVQVSPSYHQASAQYQKFLTQRNALLKSINLGQQRIDALEPWDGALAKHAAHITRQRLKLMEAFNLSFVSELRELGEQWSEAVLVHKRDQPQAEDEEGLAKLILAALIEQRERDVLLATTTVGPHRDDWFANVDGRDFSTFASRGQERAAVLALLLLSVSYLELHTGEKPIILLDDAFSELDDTHREALLHVLQDHQVIFTTTHLPADVRGASVLHVEAGSVTPSARATPSAA